MCQCRNIVKQVRKNHIVNNLVAAYLKEHPEKRRPEEDIKELDEKNKIQSAVVRTGHVHDCSTYICIISKLVICMPPINVCLPEVNKFQTNIEILT